MNWLTTLTALFEPLAKLIDNVHTSDDERNRAKLQLVELQNAVTTQVLALEQQLVSSREKMATAEANGHSWLQRNWRPLTMLSFVGLMAAHWLGFTAPGLTEAERLALMDIINLGLTGYIVGRSVEKVAPQLVQTIGAKKEGK